MERGNGEAQNIVCATFNSESFDLVPLGLAGLRVVLPRSLASLCWVSARDLQPAHKPGTVGFPKRASEAQAAPRSLAHSSARAHARAASVVGAPWSRRLALRTHTSGSQDERKGDEERVPVQEEEQIST